jgi:integrase/recombinase XerC
MKDSWDKYINLFLDYLKAERNASPYTIRNYGRTLGDFAVFIREKGIATPRKVDKPAVRRYLNHLNELGIARSSVNRDMSALRSFFRYLLREGMVGKNPAANIASPKLDRRLPSFLTVDEAKRLVESPDLPERTVDVSQPVLQRNIAMLELLYASGIRVSELVNMNVEQMNLAANEILVRGKGSKERMVLIGGPAARALATYLNEARPALVSDKKTSALFINRYGRRLNVRRVQKLLVQYARFIDKKVHPHILRHTFATHLLDGGADLKVVQELLGHADLSSTQIYTHVTQAQARRIYLAAHPLARGEGGRHE